VADGDRLGESMRHYLKNKLNKRKRIRGACLQEVAEALSSISRITNNNNNNNNAYYKDSERILSLGMCFRISTENISGILNRPH
jgi:hypothetical protein